MTSDPVLEFIDTVLEELRAVVDRLEKRKVELRESNDAAE